MCALRSKSSIFVQCSLMLPTGPDLAEDHLGALVEPFVRVEASSNRDANGVGFGLAIARTMIQALGGCT